MVAQYILPTLALPALIALSLYSAPAHAVTFLEFGPEIGARGMMQFQGLSGETGLESLAASVTFTLVDRTEDSFTFAYEARNLAGGEFTSARLFGFGFNLSDKPKTITADGLYGRVGSGNLPGAGKVDVCLMAGGSGKACAPSGSGGLGIGSLPAEGSFTLSYKNPMESVQISNGSARWNDLSAPEAGMDDEDGTAVAAFIPLDPMPEPGSWAMLIAGFGMVGTALRRQRPGARMA